MRYIPHPDLMVTDLGDELMLVNASTGEVFRLNGSGRVLWQALPADHQRLVDVLTGTYDVDRAIAERDAASAVDDWVRRGVLSPA